MNGYVFLYFCSECYTTLIVKELLYIDPFVPNAPFLYPLKT